MASDASGDDYRAPDVPPRFDDSASSADDALPVRSDSPPPVPPRPDDELADAPEELKRRMRAALELMADANAEGVDAVDDGLPLQKIESEMRRRGSEDLKNDAFEDSALAPRDNSNTSGADYVPRVPRTALLRMLSRTDALGIHRPSFIGKNVLQRFRRLLYLSFTMLFGLFVLNAIIVALSMWALVSIPPKHVNVDLIKLDRLDQQVARLAVHASVPMRWMYYLFDVSVHESTVSLFVPDAVKDTTKSWQPVVTIKLPRVSFGRSGMAVKIDDIPIEFGVDHVSLADLVDYMVPPEFGGSAPNVRRVTVRIKTAVETHSFWVPINVPLEVPFEVELPPLESSSEAAGGLEDSQPKLAILELGDGKDESEDVATRFHLWFPRAWVPPFVHVTVPQLSIQLGYKREKDTEISALSELSEDPSYVAELSVLPYVLDGHAEENDARLAVAELRMRKAHVPGVKSIVQAMARSRGDPVGLVVCVSGAEEPKDQPNRLQQWLAGFSYSVPVKTILDAVPQTSGETTESTPMSLRSFLNQDGSLPAELTFGGILEKSALESAAAVFTASLPASHVRSFLPPPIKSTRLRGRLPRIRVDFAVEGGHIAAAAASEAAKAQDTKFSEPVVVLRASVVPQSLEKMDAANGCLAVDAELTPVNVGAIIKGVQSHAQTTAALADARSAKRAARGGDAGMLASRLHVCLGGLAAQEHPEDARAIDALAAIFALRIDSSTGEAVFVTTELTELAEAFSNTSGRSSANAGQRTLPPAHSAVHMWLTSNRSDAAITAVAALPAAPLVPDVPWLRVSWKATDVVLCGNAHNGEPVPLARMQLAAGGARALLLPVAGVAQALHGGHVAFRLLLSGTVPKRMPLSSTEPVIATIGLDTIEQDREALPHGLFTAWAMTLSSWANSKAFTTIPFSVLDAARTDWAWAADLAGGSYGDVALRAALGTTLANRGYAQPLTHVSPGGQLYVPGRLLVMPHDVNVSEVVTRIIMTRTRVTGFDGRAVQALVEILPSRGRHSSAALAERQRHAQSHVFVLTVDIPGMRTFGCVHREDEAQHTPVKPSKSHAPERKASVLATYDLPDMDCIAEVASAPMALTVNFVDNEICDVEAVMRPLDRATGEQPNSPTGAEKGRATRPHTSSAATQTDKLVNSLALQLAPINLQGSLDVAGRAIIGKLRSLRCSPGFPLGANMERIVVPRTATLLELLINGIGASFPLNIGLDAPHERVSRQIAPRKYDSGRVPMRVTLRAKSSTPSNASVAVRIRFPKPLIDPRLNDEPESGRRRRAVEVRKMQRTLASRRRASFAYIYVFQWVRWAAEFEYAGALVNVSCTPGRFALRPDEHRFVRPRQTRRAVPSVPDLTDFLMTDEIKFNLDLSVATGATPADEFYRLMEILRLGSLVQEDSFGSDADAPDFGKDQALRRPLTRAERKAEAMRAFFSKAVGKGAVSARVKTWPQETSPRHLGKAEVSEQSLELSSLLLIVGTMVERLQRAASKMARRVKSRSLHHHRSSREKTVEQTVLLKLRSFPRGRNIHLPCFLPKICNPAKLDRRVRHVNLVQADMYAYGWLQPLLDKVGEHAGRALSLINFARHPVLFRLRFSLPKINTILAINGIPALDMTVRSLKNVTRKAVISYDYVRLAQAELEEELLDQEAAAGYERVESLTIEESSAYSSATSVTSNYEPVGVAQYFKEYGRWLPQPPDLWVPPKARDDEIRMSVRIRLPPRLNELGELLLPYSFDSKMIPSIDPVPRMWHHGRPVEVHFSPTALGLSTEGIDSANLLSVMIATVVPELPLAPVPAKMGDGSPPVIPKIELIHSTADKAILLIKDVPLPNPMGCVWIKTDDIAGFRYVHKGYEFVRARIGKLKIAPGMNRLNITVAVSKNAFGAITSTAPVIPEFVSFMNGIALSEPMEAKIVIELSRKLSLTMPVQFQRGPPDMSMVNVNQSGPQLATMHEATIQLSKATSSIFGTLSLVWRNIADVMGMGAADDATSTASPSRLRRRGLESDYDDDETPAKQLFRRSFDWFGNRFEDDSEEDEDEEPTQRPPAPAQQTSSWSLSGWYNWGIQKLQDLGITSANTQTARTEENENEDSEESQDDAPTDPGNEDSNVVPVRLNETVQPGEQHVDEEALTSVPEKSGHDQRATPDSESSTHDGVHSETAAKKQPSLPENLNGHDDVSSTETHTENVKSSDGVKQLVLTDQPDLSVELAEPAADKETTGNSSSNESVNSIMADDEEVAGNIKRGVQLEESDSAETPVHSSLGASLPKIAEVKQDSSTVSNGNILTNAVVDSQSIEEADSVEIAAASQSVDQHQDDDDPTDMLDESHNLNSTIFGSTANTPITVAGDSLVPTGYTLSASSDTVYSEDAPEQDDEDAGSSSSASHSSYESEDEAEQQSTPEDISLQNSQDSVSQLVLEEGELGRVDTLADSEDRSSTVIPSGSNVTSNDNGGVIDDNSQHVGSVTTSDKHARLSEVVLSTLTDKEEQQPEDSNMIRDAVNSMNLTTSPSNTIGPHDAPLGIESVADDDASNRTHSSMPSLEPAHSPVAMEQQHTLAGSYSSVTVSGEHDGASNHTPGHGGDSPVIDKSRTVESDSEEGHVEILPTALVDTTTSNIRTGTPSPNQTEDEQAPGPILAVQVTSTSEPHTDVPNSTEDTLESSGSVVSSQPVESLGSYVTAFDGREPGNEYLRTAMSDVVMRASPRDSSPAPSPLQELNSTAQERQPNDIPRIDERETAASMPTVPDVAQSNSTMEVVQSDSSDDSLINMIVSASDDGDGESRNIVSQTIQHLSLTPVQPSDLAFSRQPDQVVDSPPHIPIATLTPDTMHHTGHNNKAKDYSNEEKSSSSDDYHSCNDDDTTQLQDIHDKQNDHNDSHSPVASDRASETSHTLSNEERSDLPDSINSTQLGTSLILTHVLTTLMVSGDSTKLPTGLEESFVDVNAVLTYDPSAATLQLPESDRMRQLLSDESNAGGGLSSTSQLSHPNSTATIAASIAGLAHNRDEDSEDESIGQLTTEQGHLPAASPLASRNAGDEQLPDDFFHMRLPSPAPESESSAGEHHSVNVAAVQIAAICIRRMDMSDQCTALVRSFDMASLAAAFTPADETMETYISNYGKKIEQCQNGLRKCTESPDSEQTSVEVRQEEQILSSSPTDNDSTLVHVASEQHSNISDDSPVLSQSPSQRPGESTARTVAFDTPLRTVLKESTESVNSPALTATVQSSQPSNPTGVSPGILHSELEVITDTVQHAAPLANNLGLNHAKETDVPLVRRTPLAPPTIVGIKHGEKTPDMNDITFELEPLFNKRAVPAAAIVTQPVEVHMMRLPPTSSPPLSRAGNVNDAPSTSDRVGTAHDRSDATVSSSHVSAKSPETLHTTMPLASPTTSQPGLSSINSGARMQVPLPIFDPDSVTTPPDSAVRPEPLRFTGFPLGTATTASSPDNSTEARADRETHHGLFRSDTTSIRLDNIGTAFQSRMRPPSDSIFDSEPLHTASHTATSHPQPDPDSEASVASPSAGRRTHTRSGRGTGSAGATRHRSSRTASRTAPVLPPAAQRTRQDVLNAILGIGGGGGGSSGSSSSSSLSGSRRRASRAPSAGRRRRRSSSDSSSTEEFDMGIVDRDPFGKKLSRRRRKREEKADRAEKKRKARRRRTGSASTSGSWSTRSWDADAGLLTTSSYSSADSTSVSSDAGSASGRKRQEGRARDRGRPPRTRHYDPRPYTKMHREEARKVLKLVQPFVPSQPVSKAVRSRILGMPRRLYRRCVSDAMSDSFDEDMASVTGDLIANAAGAGDSLQVTSSDRYISDSHSGLRHVSGGIARQVAMVMPAGDGARRLFKRAHSPSSSSSNSSSEDSATRPARRAPAPAAPASLGETLWRWLRSLAGGVGRTVARADEVRVGVVVNNPLDFEMLVLGAHVTALVWLGNPSDGAAPLEVETMAGPDDAAFGTPDAQLLRQFHAHVRSPDMHVIGAKTRGTSATALMVRIGRISSTAIAGLRTRAVEGACARLAPSLIVGGIRAPAEMAARWPRNRVQRRLAALHMDLALASGSRAPFVVELLVDVPQMDFALAPHSDPCLKSVSCFPARTAVLSRPEKAATIFRYGRGGACELLPIPTRGLRMGHSLAVTFSFRTHVVPEADGARGPNVPPAWALVFRPADDCLETSKMSKKKKATKLHCGTAGYVGACGGALSSIALVYEPTTGRTAVHRDGRAVPLAERVAAPGFVTGLRAGTWHSALVQYRPGENALDLAVYSRSNDVPGGRLYHHVARFSVPELTAVLGRGERNPRLELALTTSRTSTGSTVGFGAPEVVAALPDLARSRVYWLGNAWAPVGARGALLLELRDSCGRVVALAPASRVRVRLSIQRRRHGVPPVPCRVRPVPRSGVYLVMYRAPAPGRYRVQVSPMFRDRTHDPWTSVPMTTVYVPRMR